MALTGLGASRAQGHFGCTLHGRTVLVSQDGPRVGRILCRACRDIDAPAPVGPKEFK